MKIRSVRPEFFADPTMAELSAEARLLYIGLWCYVDDDGRGEWLPKQIDGLIFPLEDVDVHALLTQLVNTERIVRYTDGDRDYFYIPTFSEYQKPNRKYDSKLPDPADCTELAGQTTLSLTEQRVSSADAHAVGGEGEGEVGGEVVIAPAARPRDPLWDVAAEKFGTPKTPTERGKRNKELKELRDAGITPEELEFAIQKSVLRWPDARSGLRGIIRNLGDLLDGFDVSKADVEKYQSEVRRLEREKRAQELDSARGLPQ